MMGETRGDPSAAHSRPLPAMPRAASRSVRPARNAVALPLPGDPLPCGVPCDCSNASHVLYRDSTISETGIQ